MQVYSDPSRENDTYALPDVEVFFVHAMPRKAYDRTYAADICSGEYGESGCEGHGCEHCPEPGWYYQFCFPGCMPESDPFGPYPTAEEATRAAQDQH